MKTNFFTTISPMLKAGLNLTINLKKEGDNIVVGIRPQYPDSKSEAIERIAPMVLTHGAEQLDDNFFDTITSPLEVADSVAAFLEDLEKIKTEAEAEKKKAKEALKAKKPEPAKPQQKPVVKKPTAEKPDPQQALITDFNKHCEAADKSYVAGLNNRGEAELKKAYEVLAKIGDTSSEYPRLLQQAQDITDREQQRQRAILNTKCEDIFKEAKAKIAALNYPEGVKLLNKVLELDPGFALAIEMKNSLCAKLGEATIIQLGKL